MLVECMFNINFLDLLFTKIVVTTSETFQTRWQSFSIDERREY